MTANLYRFAAIHTRAVYDQRLTAGEFRVLAAIATYADPDGWCFPGQRTVADRLGASRTFVSGAVKKLVDLGYLETKSRNAKGRGKVGLLYRVRLDMPDMEMFETTTEKPAVANGEHRPRSQATPTSARDDIGADVVVRRLPMLPSDDIHRGRTPPIEHHKESRRKATAEQAIAFWDELRPHLSTVGKRRGRPLMIAKSLPALLDKHGHDTLMRAARLFYATGDCAKPGGEFQPGLQVICNDGRLESCVEEARKPREKVWSSARQAYV